MTTAAAQHRAGNPALIFTAEMYGLQLDQLAALLGGSVRQARVLAGSWARLGLAETAVLGPGPAWVWLTRAGLRACGLRYAAAPPALSRLAHIRAVTAVRLALEAVPSYRESDAHWRSERHLRARLRVPARDHLPDAEVHWPGPPGPRLGGRVLGDRGRADAEDRTRTVAIMRDLLGRTGDYGCPAAEARVPGLPPRHARALYVCSPVAARTVLRARRELGSLAARIEVRSLPEPAPGGTPEPAGSPG